MDSFDPNRVSVRSAHFIGGQYVEGAGVIDVARPSDGVVYAALPLADAALVDEAVENAWRAFKTSDWTRRAPRERARVMRRWAELIEADVATLAPLEALGSTRPVADAARWDVPFTAEGIRFFSEWADRIGGEVAATRPDHLGMTVAEPYGVIAAIAPWNFPLVMASWKVAPALAAGNAVVLKPSELTPFSVLRLAELAVEAGIPPGIFNVVQGDGRTTGDALCRHPKIAKVTFTGSSQTGAAIMTACAQTGTKPVTLELGGKSPQLVFAQVPDLAHTARCVARGFTANGGQACVAGTRLIVHKQIAEPLIDAVQRELAGIAPGAMWSSATRYSPIISAAQAQRIATLIDESRAQGAEVLCGGGFFEGTEDGWFHRPTLLANVTDDTPAVREELFGPVLTVQTFEDEEQGITLAAHPTYGLAAGVHTSDIGQAMRAMRRIAAGTVWINRYGRSGDMIIPTGGFKQSGIGKDLGRQALEASMRHKSVLIDFDTA